MHSFTQPKLGLTILVTDKKARDEMAKKAGGKGPLGGGGIKKSGKK